MVLSQILLTLSLGALASSTDHVEAFVGPLTVADELSGLFTVAGQSYLFRDDMEKLFVKCKETALFFSLPFMGSLFNGAYFQGDDTECLKYLAKNKIPIHATIKVSHYKELYQPHPFGIGNLRHSWFFKQLLPLADAVELNFREMKRKDKSEFLDYTWILYALRGTPLKKIIMLGCYFFNYPIRGTYAGWFGKMTPLGEAELDNECGDFVGMFRKTEILHLRSPVKYHFKSWNAKGYTLDKELAENFHKQSVTHLIHDVTSLRIDYAFSPNTRSGAAFSKWLINSKVDTLQVPLGNLSMYQKPDLIHFTVVTKPNDDLADLNDLASLYSQLKSLTIKFDVITDPCQDLNLDVFETLFSLTRAIPTLKALKLDFGVPIASSLAPALLEALKTALFKHNEAYGDMSVSLNGVTINDIVLEMDAIQSGKEENVAEMLMKNSYLFTKV